MAIVNLKWYHWAFILFITFSSTPSGPYELLGSFIGITAVMAGIRKVLSSDDDEKETEADTQQVTKT